jgi:hypothetical protein
MVIKRIFMLFISASVPFLDTNPFYKEVRLNEELIEIYGEKGGIYTPGRGVVWGAKDCACSAFIVR